MSLAEGEEHVFLGASLRADLMHHQELILDWSNETRWPKHVILQYRWYGKPVAQNPPSVAGFDLLVAVFLSGLGSWRGPLLRLAF